MFSGGALERLSHLRARHHAVHLGLHHHADDVRGGADSGRSCKKEGEAGPAQDHAVHALRHGGPGDVPVDRRGRSRCRTRASCIDPGPRFVFTAAVTLVTGTMFLMWLGEQITERGIGNGISMIILAGIIAGLPAAIGGTLELVRTGEMQPALALILLVLVLGVTASSCSSSAASGGSRCNYAKRQQGRRMYAGPDHAPAVQDQHVRRDPADFRLQHHPVPGDDRQLVRHQRGLRLAAGHRRAACQPGQPVYMMLYAALIIFFCFFYTALVFNSRETADNLKTFGRVHSRVSARASRPASTSTRC